MPIDISDRIGNGWSIERALTVPKSGATQQARTVTFRGKTHTLREWSKITGVPESTLYQRYGKGWDVERMLTLTSEQAKHEAKQRHTEQMGFRCDSQPPTKPKPKPSQRTKPIAGLEYNGEFHSFSQWAEITGIPMRTLRSRAGYGWPPERILNEPVTPKRKAA